MFKPFILGIVSCSATVSLSAADRHLQVSDFSSAADCGTCHTEIHQQWQTSMHSQATRDPVFWQMLPQAARDLGEEATAFCLTCHAPVATVAKAIPIHGPMPLPLRLEPVAGEGVTCDFCHTISGEENFGKDISRGIYLYPRKGNTAVKYGTHADATTPSHAAMPSKFMKNAEVCGICHKFSHLASGQVWQDTYEEWKRGPYPGMGVGCQDCHMPRYAGRSAPGAPERKDLHAHVFPGGHSEMVKNVASVKLQARDLGKNNVKVKAMVTNSGSGHLMPTGIPGIRQMWLELTVRDAQGGEVFTNTTPIGIELLGADGKPTMPWNAVKLGKDTRIRPRKTRELAWEFPAPVGDAGLLQATVSVYYRSISEMAAKAAGIQPSPAILIASDELKFFPDSRAGNLVAK